MNLKHLTIGVVLVVLMTVSGCAFYGGGYYGRPYEHDDSFGYPRHHRYDDHNRDYHHGGHYDNNGYRHEDRDRY